MTDQDKELQNQPQDQNPQGGWQNQPQNPNPQNNWQDPPQNPSAQPGPGGQQPPYGNGQPPYGQNNPYGSGPWPNQPYRGPEPPKQKNSYATVSLVSGIFGLLTLCCMAFPIAIILGVGAIAFAVISKQGRPMTGPAIAGIILGAFCIVLGIGEFLYILAVSAFMKDPENAAMFNEIYNQLEQQMNQMNQ